MRRMLVATITMAAFLTILFATSAGPGVAQINVQLPDSALRQVQITPQALQLRRVAMLRAAGVTPPPGGLRESAVVSVGTPVVTNARLQFFGLSNYMPQIPAYGSAAMLANAAAGDTSCVEIRFRADAGIRHIVDCSVTGPATSFQFERLTGARTARREVSTVTVSEGRVGAVIPPLAATGDQTVFLKGRDNHWYFHQCEIVPVR